VGHVGCGKFPIRLWKSYQKNHLVANRENLGDGNYGFCLRNISFILVVSLHAVQSYDMGPSAFSTKEVVLRIIIAVKNPSSSAGFESVNPGSSVKHTNYQITDATRS
jgi:hypothetical protein